MCVGVPVGITGKGPPRCSAATFGRYDNSSRMKKLTSGKNGRESQNLQPIDVDETRQPNKHKRTYTHVVKQQTMKHDFTVRNEMGDGNNVRQGACGDNDVAQRVMDERASNLENRG